MPTSLIASTLAGAALIAAGAAHSQKAQTLPNRTGSVKFAVLGDSGTGKRSQYEVAVAMNAFRSRFDYKTVVLTGGSIQGSARPRDFMEKFETPYKPLLADGVKFYASLGDRDMRELRYYKLFNMNGKTYYAFSPAPGVRFFVLDSKQPDDRQMAWLDKELAASGDEWKIVAFHHPRLREKFEPVFVRHNVSAVFNTHDRAFAGVKAKNGIGYFLADELSFIAAEIDGEEMHFNVVSRSGTVVDSGVVTRRK